MFKKDEVLFEKYLEQYRNDERKTEYKLLINKLYDIINNFDDARYAKDLEKYILLKPYKLEDLRLLTEYIESVYQAINNDKGGEFDIFIDHCWAVESEFLDGMSGIGYKTYDEMREYIEDEFDDEVLEQFEEINSSDGAKFAYLFDGMEIGDWYKYRSELLKEFYEDEFEVVNKEFVATLDLL